MTEFDAKSFQPSSELANQDGDPGELFARCERSIDSILAAPVSTQDSEEREGGVAGFKGQWLPKVVECALYRQTHSDHVARTVRFLRAVLQLIVRHAIPLDDEALLRNLLQIFDAQEAPALWAPLAGVKKIASSSPRLYLDHGSRVVVPPAAEDQASSDDTKTSRYKDRDARIYVQLPPTNNSSTPPVLLVDMINTFGRLGGFDAIMRRLESSEPRRPHFECLRTFARLAHTVRTRLDRQVFADLVWVIKESTPVILLGVEDKSLKVLARADFDRVIAILQDLIVSVVGVLSSALVKNSITMLKLELDFAWIRSNQLEKRLRGLRQLRETVELASKRASSFSNRTAEQLDLPFLLDWLDEKKIIEELFGPHMHVELLKRAISLLRILAHSNRMTTRHLTSLWQCASGAHEAVQRVLYGIIADLVPVLAPPLRRFLFEHISSLPVDKYDEHTLALVFNFTVRASQLRSSGTKAALVDDTPARAGDGRRRGQVSHTPTREMYGLRVLWDFLQDAPADNITLPSPELTEQAVSLLVRLLRMPHFVPEREPLMQQCLENLHRHSSVEASLLVLQRILVTYPPRRRVWVSFSTRDVDGSISGIIEALDRTHGLLTRFFLDLQRYQAGYRACFTSEQAESTVQSVLSRRFKAPERIEGVLQRFPYGQAISVRLQFLTFILTNSSVTLGEVQVGMLWDNLVNDSIGLPDCQDTVLQWFQVACSSMVPSPAQTSGGGSPVGSSDVVQSSGSPEPIATGSMVAFSDSVLPFLFQSKLQNLNPESISSSASKLFIQLFLDVNVRSKALRWVTSSDGKANEWVRQTADLQGEKFLWELMLKSTDDAIIDSAMNLLIELNHRLSPKLTQAKRDRISGDFVRRCIHRLSTFVPYLNLGTSREVLQVGQPPEQGETRPVAGKSAAQFVSRCVLLLQQFLERYHEHPYRQIRIELVTGKSDTVITEIHLPSSATVRDLHKAAADFFKEPPDMINLSRPSASRFSSAESLDNFDSALDSMKFLSRPTVLVQKIIPARIAERAFNHSNIGQVDLIDIADVKTSHIEVAVPRSLLVPLPPSTAGVRDQWEDILPPPLPYKEDMVLAPGLARPIYRVHTTPAATVPLETHLEQFPTHFEQLLSLLDLRLDENIPHMDENVSAMVWRILQALPTHMTLLRDLRSLKAAEKGSWKVLLDESSLFKALCALHIIDAFVTAGATHPSDCEPHFAWASKFLHLGGVEHLTVILSNVAAGLEADAGREINSVEHARVEARVSCVAIIHRILHLVLQLDPMYRRSNDNDGTEVNTPSAWGEHRAPSGMVVSVVDMHSLVSSALKVLLCIIEVRSTDDTTVTAAAHTMQLVLGCVRCSAQGREAFCQFAGLDKWLHAFTLRVPNIGVRHTVCSALFQMCSISGYLDYAAETRESNILITILEHLVPLIPLVSETRKGSAQLLVPTKQSEHFFSLVCGTVLVVTWSETLRSKFEEFQEFGECTLMAPAFSPMELAEKIFSQMRSHPMTESFHSLGTDHSFAGLMRLLAILMHGLQNSDQVLSGTLANEEMVNFIYEGCLFALTARNKGSAASDEASTFGARCKSSFSRTMAYALLVEVCCHSNRNLKCLLDMTKFGTVRAGSSSSLHIQGQSDDDTESRDQKAESVDRRGVVMALPEWNYDPESFLKETSDRIGLMNQGATCYMNSLLQQLFHTSAFSLQLLRVDAGDGDTEENHVLQQLQVLFGHLKLSHKKYYDTMPFCKVFRDFDGEHIQVSEQKDVYEFGTMLFDKLEMSHAEVKKLLNDTFGGTLVYQIISNEPGCAGEQLSERAEPYLMLTAEVKNKSSLQDSMELYVAGEPLSGDNRYEHKGKLVEACRRCAIRSLPPTLIVHLKRFEYDLTTYTKCKVNDYFSFPVELDMLPYTEEGNMRGSKAPPTGRGDGLDEPTTDIEDDEKPSPSIGTSGVAETDVSETTFTGDETEVETGGNGANIPVNTDKESRGDSVRPVMRDKNYYRYVLKGIVAHTGTADSGHYYSFIRDADSKAGESKWFEFNDKDVTAFNESAIPRECFGGVDTTDPHGAKGRVRNNNAYLLVYDRISTNLNSEGSAGETSILNNQRTTSIRDNEVLASANKIAEDELPDSAADIMQKRRSKLPQRRSRSDSLSYLDHSSHLDSHLPDSLQQMHPRVQYAVWHDLMLFLDDRHVFTRDFFRFNWNLLELVECCRRSAEKQDAGDITSIALNAFQTGLRFAVEVIAHARAKTCLEPWCEHLEAIMMDVPAVADWIVGALSEPASWLLQMIVVCPHGSTKGAFVNLITRALVVIRDQQRRIYLGGESGQRLKFAVDLNDASSGTSDGDHTSDSIQTGQLSEESKGGDMLKIQSKRFGLNDRAKSSTARLLCAVLDMFENEDAQVFSMAYVLQLLHNFSLLGVEECHLLLALHVPHRCVGYSARLLPGNDPCLKPMMGMLAQV